MDDRRFDEFTKVLATGSSRRLVIKGLASTLLGGVLTRLHLSDTVADGGIEKVTVCHQGNTLEISTSALQAHHSHGDTAPDFNSDPSNCGGCNVICADEETCSSGSCIARTGRNCPDCGATCQACDFDSATQTTSCGSDCDDSCTAALLCTQANATFSYLMLKIHLRNFSFVRAADPEAAVLRQDGIQIRSALARPYTNELTGETATLVYATDTDTENVAAYAIVLGHNGLPNYGLIVGENGQVQEVAVPSEPVQIGARTGGRAFATIQSSDACDDCTTNFCAIQLGLGVCGIEATLGTALLGSAAITGVVLSGDTLLLVGLSVAVFCAAGGLVCNEYCEQVIAGCDPL